MDVKVTKSLLMTALITGSVMFGSGAAFAAESVGEFELDPMVVTAQRMEKRDTIGGRRKRGRTSHGGPLGGTGKALSKLP